MSTTSASGGGGGGGGSGVPLDADKVRTKIQGMINEFFVNRDPIEAVYSMNELKNNADQKYEVVIHAINMAMDKHEKEREQAALLLEG